MANIERRITRSRAIKQEPIDVDYNVAVSQKEIKPPIQLSMDIKPPIGLTPAPPQDECCICQGKTVDPARLDCCEHVECFLCLKHWLKHSMNCCMCREVPQENIIRLQKNGPERFYPLQDLIKEKEKEDRERAAADVPLTFERSIIRRAKREYQAAVEQINRAPHRLRICKKSAKKMYHQRLADIQYSQMVEAQNALNVILDENNRKTVISNHHFRMLIYKYSLEWYPATETTLNRGGTYAPRYARDHEDTERSRMTAFIVKELDNVQYKNYPTRKYQRRLQLADSIFDKMKVIPVQAPPFLRVFDHDCQIRREHAARLQQEIFNFAASGLSEDDYYTISCYRKPSSPNNQGNQNVFAVGGLNPTSRQPEIITVDDEQEDDDDIQIEHEQINVVPNESNFLRDDHVSSGSERDVLFQRRACRFQQPPFLPALPAFYPGTGVSYNAPPQHPFENVMRNFANRSPLGLEMPPQLISVFSNHGQQATPAVNILSSPEQTPREAREESVEFVGFRAYEPRSPEYQPRSPEYEPRSPEQLMEIAPPTEQEVEVELALPAEEVAEAPIVVDEPSSSGSDGRRRRHRSKLEKHRDKYFKYLDREENISKLRRECKELKRKLKSKERYIEGQENPRRSSRTRSSHFDRRSHQ